MRILPQSRFHSLKMEDADIKGGTTFSCLVREWTTNTVASNSYFNCSFLSTDCQTYWTRRVFKSRFALTAPLLWSSRLIKCFSLGGQSGSNLNLPPPSPPLGIIKPPTPSFHIILHPTDFSYHSLFIRSFSESINDYPPTITQSCNSRPLAWRKL